MFFRFVSALFLVVLISMVGIGLEKQTLEMKRAVSRQYFQKDILLELHARHRLEIQKLTSPQEDVRDASIVQRPARPSTADDRENSLRSEQPSSPRLPLLRWEHPARTNP